MYYSEFQTNTNTYHTYNTHSYSQPPHKLISLRFFTAVIVGIVVAVILSILIAIAIIIVIIVIIRYYL